MSEALTVLNNNTALAQGGVGLGFDLFKAKPSYIEIVQAMSRQKDVQIGRFRATDTNEHFDVLRVVLLNIGVQREWFEGKEFNKDSKQCFSTDGIQPHARAKNPPALYCATCSKGDINWEKYRKSNNPDDIPPCGMFYHLFLAERSTQTAYYFNVKGKSVSPFKKAMQTKMGGILTKLEANVKAENRAKGFMLDPKTGVYVPAPGVTIPEGVTATARPNIFDISFEMSIVKDGAVFVLETGKFAYMKPEDRAEFGNMYLEYENRRKAQPLPAELEDAVSDAAVENQAVEKPASTVVPENDAVIAAPPGEIVGKDVPITI
jgi:hypothetical protein